CGVLVGCTPADASTKPRCSTAASPRPYPPRQVDARAVPAAQRSPDRPDRQPPVPWKPRGMGTPVPRLRTARACRLRATCARCCSNAERCARRLFGARRGGHPRSILPPRRQRRRAQRHRERHRSRRRRGRIRRAPLRPDRWCRCRLDPPLLDLPLLDRPLLDLPRLDLPRLCLPRLCLPRPRRPRWERGPQQPMLQAHRRTAGRCSMEPWPWQRATGPWRACTSPRSI
ncbi:MAG: hypothetical protein RIR65_1661, partial [Planctomycetota bacterium]